MRERNKKTNADGVAKRLFESAALREAEIDRVTASDDLFGAVLARIKTIDNRQPESRKGVLALVNEYRAILASASAALLVVSAFGFLLLQKSSHESLTANSGSASRPTSAPPDSTPQVDFVKGFTQGSAEIFEAEKEEPAVRRTAVRQSERPREISAQPAVYQSSETQPEFYPVTYVGDGEAVRGGRVVRVDLPRSSLFAMGVNVPLENESPTVRADLLIGPDGVTRAIRFVE